MTTPEVTILVPARDEEPWIEACLESVADQDYPHHLLEVIVVIDAASADRTDVLAKDTLARCAFGRTEVVRNATGTTPANLNAGLALARGEVLCRVDARSRIPSNYVSRCVSILTTRPEVAVVGGAQVAVSPRTDAMGTGIARALNNRWSMGLSRYRRGAASGAADTVYLGAFRTAELREAGGWSREFPTNQDFELNRRLRDLGMVWFDASIPVGYIPRASLLDLHRQYVRFGHWKARYWRQTSDRPRPRQVALLVGVPLFVLGGVATTCILPRRRELVALAAIAALALEARGTSGPSGGPRARVYAVAAMAAVATGWLAGAWRELLHPTRGG